MSTHLRDLLLFPVRTPSRAVLTVFTMALLAAGGWYGFRVLRFGQDQAAAKEALAGYDFPEAYRRLTACLRWRPHDPETLLLAAQAARREGLLDEAEEHLERYSNQLGRSTPEGALQSILVRVQRGAVKEHVHSLLDYVEIRHPDSEQILESLARGCVHVYRLDEATFWTKQLLQRFPHNPVGRLIDAQTNETLRRRERALELTRQLVEDYPHDDKARLYLAGLLSKIHRYDDAAGHYREMHRRQPESLVPLLGLIRSLLALGRTEEAEPLLAEMEQRHGDNSEALLECGRFAVNRKRPADAERLLRRAVELAPNDADVHFVLASCLGQLNRKEESQRHLERFKQIQADLMSLDKAFQAMVKAPADPGPRLEAGRVCLRNGQETEGLRWLFGALDLSPDHGPTHRALAEHFETVGDTSRAEYHRTRAR